MPQGRVQVEDLPGPERIRVVQTAGDTFRGAEKPPVDPTAGELASALGKWSDTLSGLSVLAMREQKKRTENEGLAKANQIRATYNNDQYLEAAGKGEVILNDNTAPGAFNAQEVGKLHAQKAIDQIKVGIMDGSIPYRDDNNNPINVDGMIANAAKQHLSTLDPQWLKSAHFMSAFQGTTASLRGSVLEATQKQAAAYNTALNDQTVTLAFNQMIDKMGSTSSLEEAQTIRNNTYETLRAGVLGKHLPDGTKAYQRLDQLYLGRLETLAKTDPIRAEKLLNMDRGKGADGQPLGSIASNPLFADQVNRIKQSVNDGKRQVFDKEVEQAAVNEAAAALKADNGSFDMLGDKRYANPYDKYWNQDRTVSAATIKQKALDQATDRLMYDLRQRGVTDPGVVGDTRFQHSVQTYQRAGMPDPVYKGLIESSVRGLNPNNVNDAEGAAKFEAANKEYDRLKSVNPGYVDKQLGLSEEAKKAHDSYSALKAVGIPEQVAYATAARIATGPKVQLDANAAKVIDDKATALGKSFLFPGSGNGWFGGDNARVVEVRNKIREVANTFASSGMMEPEKAAEAAAKFIEKSAVRVNGAIFINDPNVTQENANLYIRKLGDYFDRFPKGTIRTLDGEPVKNASDLTLDPNRRGGNSYVVVDRKTGSPVSVMVNENGSIVPKQMSVPVSEIRNVQRTYEAWDKKTVAEQLGLNQADYMRRLPELIDEAKKTYEGGAKYEPNYHLTELKKKRYERLLQDYADLKKQGVAPQMKQLPLEQAPAIQVPTP